MKYALRRATEADYDFLFALHGQTIRPAVEAMWGWDDADQARRFRSKWNPDEILVVVVDGVDVGTLKLEERDGDCFIGLVEVHPDFQNRGLGTAIIRDVVADANRQGRAVALNVIKTNPDARRLYERLGFRTIEERPDRYVMRLAVQPST